MGVLLPLPAVLSLNHMETIDFNVRCWTYAGPTALEDMNLGVGAGAVRDGRNKPSEAEFGDCIAIVLCNVALPREEPRYFAHLGEITGIFQGDADLLWANSGNQPNGIAYAMKPVTRIVSLPRVVAGEVFQAGINKANRSRVIHYLLTHG